MIASQIAPMDHELAMEIFQACVLNQSPDTLVDEEQIIPDDQIITQIHCNTHPGFSCSRTPGDTLYCSQFLVDGSFEQGAYQPGTPDVVVPDTSGYWQGDLAAVVTDEDQAAYSQGIRSCEGGRMLRLIASAPDGPGSAIEKSADIYQLIDLRPYAAEISTGRVNALGRLLADRIQFDAETDSRFGLTLLAMAGPMSDAPNQVFGGWLAQESNILETDNVRGWEEIITTLPLPPGTDYLAVVIWAEENNVNDPALPEFDGHFIDDVIVQLSKSCIGAVTYADVDPTFNLDDWSSGIIYDYNGVTPNTGFTVEQNAMEGNDAPCRRVDLMYDKDGTQQQGVWIGHWRNAIYDPGNTIIETVSIECDIYAPNNPIAVDMMIRQGDNYYITTLPNSIRIIGPDDGGWKPYVLGCLKPGNFALRSGPGPDLPDFSLPMQFGFSTANSSSANGIVGHIENYCYIDNFEVRVNSLIPAVN